MPRPVEDYADFRRDSVAENELCSELRRLSEAERTDYLMRLLNIDPWLAAEIGRRTNASHDFFRAVVLRHFEQGRASEADLLIRTVWQRLGPRRILGLFKARVESHPLHVWWFAYMLRYSRAWRSLGRDDQQWVERMYRELEPTLGGRP